MLANQEQAVTPNPAPAQDPEAKPHNPIIWEAFLIYPDGRKIPALTIREYWTFGQLPHELLEKRRGSWMSTMGLSKGQPWKYLRLEQQITGEIIHYCRDCIHTERPHVHPGCIGLERDHE